MAFMAILGGLGPLFTYFWGLGRAQGLGFRVGLIGFRAQALGLRFLGVGFSGRSPNSSDIYI